MRIISIRDDIEQVIRELVIAIPEVYLDYPTEGVALVERHVAEDEDRLDEVYVADIVFVESEETELVLGEVYLGGDLKVRIEIFGD